MENKSSSKKSKSSAKDGKQSTGSSSTGGAMMQPASKLREKDKKQKEAEEAKKELERDKLRNWSLKVPDGSPRATPYGSNQPSPTLSETSAMSAADLEEKKRNAEGKGKGEEVKK